MSERVPPQTNELWGDDWPEVRGQWTLDPTVTFLNHGSFGACPRPVLDRQAALRNELERQPVDFLWRRFPEQVAAARSKVATFLGADEAGFAFVPNVTAGVSTVLRSMRLRPFDEVLITDHAYPAVLIATQRACEKAGARIAIAPVPLPLPAAVNIVALVRGAMGPRTRLVVIDHVTSSTAAILPVREIVGACREADVPVLVDAAHAVGMLAVDVGALGADFWVGNLHKWTCAPKGAAALVVSPERRGDVHPLVTSHGADQGFREEFDWTGTHDPTAYLAAPAAIAFFDALGWERVRRHNHALASFGRATLAEALGTAPPVRDEAFGSMSLVALPEGAVTTYEGTLDLQDRLWRNERIEVPVTWWNERAFVRLSAQAYNAPADYMRLAEALPPYL